MAIQLSRMKFGASRTNPLNRDGSQGQPKCILPRQAWRSVRNRPPETFARGNTKRPTVKPETRTWLASLIAGAPSTLGGSRRRIGRAAEAAAVERFSLNDEQRKRHILREG